MQGGPQHPWRRGHDVGSSIMKRGSYEVACSINCACAFVSRRLMAGCGRAARLRLGWLENSAWYRSRHSVAGKRSRRLAGRSRSHVRRTRNPPRRKKWPHLKKALGCHCRGGGEASRQTHRGLRHGRAPHRPETRHAARLGAHRRASDQPMAITGSTGSTSRLSHTGDRRSLLVSVQWCVEGIFRGLARNLRA